MELSPPAPETKPRLTFLPRKRKEAILAGVLILAGITGLWILTSLKGRIVKPSPQNSPAVMPTTLSAAVEQFRADYDRLPRPVGITTLTDSGDVDTDTSAEAGLVAVLLASEPPGEPQNRRAVNYLDGFPRAKPSGSAGENPTDGLVTEPQHVTLYDAWGNLYRIRLDTDGDGFIDNPDPGNAASVPQLKARVLIWSAGQDRLDETWDDNPKSWQ